MTTPRLVSHTIYPTETIYYLWQVSRGYETAEPKRLAEIRIVDDGLNEEIDALFKRVIVSEIPVAENLEFVFMIYDCPISLREQFVRHRIGHHFGDNFAVDIIPGAIDSSWWSQSMRVLDMSNFVVEGAYHIPSDLDDEQRDVYVETLEAIEGGYAKLVQLGVPVEEARHVLPLGATMHISWKMSFSALRHVLKKRSCWLMQLGIWEPLVYGMIDELAEKIHPIFRRLADPPCFSKGEGFEGCPYPSDGIVRLLGQDPEPPCPLFMNYHRGFARTQIEDPKQMLWRENSDGLTWDTANQKSRNRFAQLRTKFSKLWRRNVWTGERVE